MRVLIVTSEWPSRKHPYAGVFVVRQAEALRNLGVSINVLNFRGKQNPLRYCNAFLRMRNLLKEERYDLVHAHFGQAGFLAVLQRHLPVVVTFHGSDLFGLGSLKLSTTIKGRGLRRISEFAARRATEVIVVSERLGRELSWRHNHTIPMGVDMSLFAPMPKKKAKESVGWPLDERSVLFVGNPANSIKRYELAFEAVGIASQTVPKVKLRVCYNEPQENVVSYLNASDILLVTSLHESGPLIVREALACNLPVVSLDVGDVRQRIGLIQGCVICEDEQPETIASGLIRVIERGCRINGRSTILGLDERYIARKVLNVYRLALNTNETKFTVK